VGDPFVTAFMVSLNTPVAYLTSTLRTATRKAGSIS
jgi:hypothetical protein